VAAIECSKLIAHIAQQVHKAVSSTVFTMRDFVCYNSAVQSKREK